VRNLVNLSSHTPNKRLGPDSTHISCKPIFYDVIFQVSELLCTTAIERTRFCCLFPVLYRFVMHKCLRGYVSFAILYRPSQIFASTLSNYSYLFPAAKWSSAKDASLCSYGQVVTDNPNHRTPIMESSLYGVYPAILCHFIMPSSTSILDVTSTPEMQSGFSATAEVSI
jgi:hypothetical protein